MLTSPNRKHNKHFFYKYATVETAKSILINKTLRFSSPLIFNDPFDVARKLKFQFSSDELNSAFCNELLCLSQNDPPVSVSNPKLQTIVDALHNSNPDQRKQYLNQIKKTFPSRNLDEIESFKKLQQQWESLLHLSRILSIAERNDNPVMWWCYADNYKGVVIELECIDIYDSPLLLARQVNYTDAIPTIGHTIGSLDHYIKKGQPNRIRYKQLFKEMLEHLELTKTSHWAHEREWRVISFEKDSDQLHSDYQVHPRTFSKIFFGENMAERDRQDIEHLINFNLSHMEIYVMILNHNCRQIQFRPRQEK